MNISDKDRLDIAANFGEWPDREAIKQFLRYEGEGGLMELSGSYHGAEAETLREWGVPERVIREYATEEVDDE